jgi:hypothetical protein
LFVCRERESIQTLQSPTMLSNPVASRLLHVTDS